MNKSVKGIIAGGIAVVLLAGAVVAIKMNENDNSSSSEIVQTANENNILSEWAEFAGVSGDYTEANISNVNISNSNDNFDVVKTGETQSDDSSSAASTAYSYTIKGLEDYKMDSSLLDTMPSAAMTAPLTVVEENSGNLSRFGLDNPQAEVNITFDDGKSINYLVGNVSPDTSLTYFCFKGSNTVYTMNTSTTNAFLNDKKYYMSLVIIDSLSDDQKLEKLSIYRKDLGYTIDYAYNASAENYKTGAGTSSNYIMTEPIYSYMNAETSKDIFEKMFGLKADSVVNIGADAQALENAGMNDPMCKLDITVSDGTTYTMKITDAPGDSDSYSLVYLEGGNLIYLVSKSSLPWTTMTLDVGTSSTIIPYYVYNIKNMDIKVNGKDEMSFEGTGSDKDDFKVTLNGEDCETERYRTFYVFILKTPAEEIYMGDVSGEPIAEMTIESQAGDKTELEFYEAEGRKLIIKVNGKVSFKCRASFLDTLKANMDKFNTSEEFSYEW